MSQNALWNCTNPHQNQKQFPTVLCVCSAGLLRSPTMAYVLANAGYNTRAAGVYDYALVRVNDVLLEWAEHIVCAEQEHAEYIKNVFKTEKPITVLNVRDVHDYRDPALVREIEEKIKEHGFDV